MALDRYYLHAKESTILGFCSNDDIAKHDFKIIAAGNGQRRISSLANTGCSDRYYTISRETINKDKEAYFGFYYVPQFVHELIDEMNEFFKNWNIIIIDEIKYGIHAGKFDDKPIANDNLEDTEEFCYSILFKVVPTDQVKKIKWFPYWFYVIRIYMHHIFRVASLTHGNFINNKFKSGRKLGYLIYVLNKSRHTKNHGYTLYEEGNIHLEMLEKFNDTRKLACLFKRQFKYNSKYGKGSGYKTYQSSLLKDLNFEIKFRKGDKISFDSSYYRNANPVFIRRTYIGGCRVIIDREEYSDDWSNSKITVRTETNANVYKIKKIKVKRGQKVW